ncbi:MAG TPA: DCC1-like thiol-disulfide oxidoreductase family protein [Bryobacteraceae bacterium]|jgi:predicted DCC family thiol-disulfide oxidoreductase YuxK|nr:DCC1-like thiol-disulfide oxidoreductase family protein [Bryobacteraceae bacterium]
MKHLTVIYDPDCGLCSRIGTWLEAQPKLLGLRMAPSNALARVYPELAARGLQEELIVVSDEGAVYLGDHAWLMCLYALKRYRHWAQRLARPALLPFARQAFKLLSANRRRVSKWLGLLSDGELEAELRQIHAPRCYGTNPETSY